MLNFVESSLRSFLPQCLFSGGEKRYVFVNKDWQKKLGESTNQRWKGRGVEQRRGREREPEEERKGRGGRECS